MRRTVLLAALACLLALGGPAFAELCTVDAVPAATLLLPYFEVGLHPADGANATADDESGSNVDTLFSINNASAAPTIAHVSFWGDWTAPTIDFDVFLTGYDVATVSLADVFNNGNLPQTLHAWQDVESAGSFADALSPHQGDNSDNPSWDSWHDVTDASTSGCDPNDEDPASPTYCPRFDSCDAPPFDQLPLPTLAGDFLDLIRLGHTGREIPLQFQGPNDEACVGSVGGATGTTQDFIARGYITIDNLNDCSIQFPNQTGYFGPTVKSQNQLWGDWYIIDEGRAIGDNLVSIEADPTAFAAGDYTFYGRYVSGLATDQREPLGSVWGARYLQPNPVFAGGTDLLVWRDAKCGGRGATPWECTGPAWANLEETQVVDFSLDEDAVELCGGTSDPGGGGVSPVPPGTTTVVQCFPIETGRYSVGEGNLNVQHEFGWLYLNLNHTLGDTGGACTTDGLFNDIAQSYVIASVDNDEGDALFNVGLAAVQLASACDTGNAGNPLAGDRDGDGFVESDIPAAPAP